MPPLVQTQKSIVVHCPSCGHFKSRHVKIVGCAICEFEIRKGWRKAAMCYESFTSRLSDREIEQARAVTKGAHNGKTRCATCLEIWWAHDGMLCPNGETLFVPLVGD